MAFPLKFDGVNDHIVITDHADLNFGDLVSMQYIANDTDVTIEQSDSWAVQGFNAYGYIQEIIV